MITPEENLKNIVDEIQKNEIMLPDFQRQFDWKIEDQVGLIASVLTKLPVGGILLLKADSSDYKCKRIGLNPKEAVLGTLPDKTNFLLDGQQRMTCLTNVFSDLIQDASGYMVSKLASRTLLATRFYLKLPRWDKDLSDQKDLFGIKKLDFKFDVSKNEEPNFLTADIADYIECRPFLASEYTNKKPYMPGRPYDDKLDDYCFQEDEYLIPLFLLIGTNPRDDKLRKKRVLAIIKRITDSFVSSITTVHCNLSDVHDQQEFAYSVLTEESERMDYDSNEDKELIFESLIEIKADLWKDDFQKYLYSCVEKMKLNKIEMPEGSRERAIDIYENMNRGGISLSTLDLVAARVAKVSQESLYNRINNYLTSNNLKDYCDSAIPTEIKSLISKDYNASKKMEAVGDRITKSCADIFLEVLGLYCNNMTYDPAEAKCVYSKAAAILKLNENQINDNCQKVCVAIDRALAFLQIRCGVQLLSDVNYKLMVRFIAYIFTNDKWYKSSDVHDKIEAWYWSAIFSGEYDKDQNERYESNLKSMLKSLNSGKAKDYTWIEDMKKNIFGTPYFSDCAFLTMEKANEGRVPKEHLGKYVCQFFLSKPYSDLITDSEEVSVFSDKKLEKHHIVPLGSVKKIGESTDALRSDKANMLNSPLNYIYITAPTNLNISDKSLKEYEEEITPSAKAFLVISNYPSVADLDDETKIKAWLTERHKTLQGVVQNRVTSLLK